MKLLNSDVFEIHSDLVFLMIKLTLTHTASWGIDHINCKRKIACLILDKIIKLSIKTAVNLHFLITKQNKQQVILKRTFWNQPYQSRQILYAHTYIIWT